MPTKIKALINPEIIKFFRIDLDLTSEFISEKLKVSHDKYISWENGDDFPTLKQVQKIAKFYKCTRTMFYLPNPPEKYKPKGINYRSILLTLSDTEKYRLQINLVEAYRRQSMVREIYEALDMTPKKIETSIKLGEDIKTAAAKIRFFLGVDKKVIRKLSNKPFELLKYWKDIIEENNIIVSQTSSYYSLNTVVMRGFCITDDFFPMIILNSSDSPNGKIFTLIHELSHILIGGKSTICSIDFRDTRYNYSDKEEIYCNQLTAEILTPASDILGLFRKGFSTQDIMREFGVSIDVVKRRLYDLKCISKKEYLEFLKLRSQEKIPVKKTAFAVPQHTKVISNNGKMFTKLVINAYNYNKISLQNVGIFLNTNTSHISKISNAIYN